MKIEPEKLDMKNWTWEIGHEKFGPKNWTWEKG
jgi:hypothetical protein